MLRRSPSPARAAQPAGDFQGLHASELFCPRCRVARPVRELLLLVLPDGELFEYRCVACGESLGKRKVQAGAQTPLLIQTR